MSETTISKILTEASSKFIETSDSHLSEGGQDWEIEELHLVPKQGRDLDRIVCRFVMRNGRRVLECTRS